MSLFETSKAAMNNMNPTTQRPNKELFNVENIKDDMIRKQTLSYTAGSVCFQ